MVAFISVTPMSGAPLPGFPRRAPQQPDPLQLSPSDLTEVTRVVGETFLARIAREAGQNGFRTVGCGLRQPAALRNGMQKLRADFNVLPNGFKDLLSTPGSLRIRQAGPGWAEVQVEHADGTVENLFTTDRVRASARPSDRLRSGRSSVRAANVAMLCTSFERTASSHV